jgi:hypothetical protein
VLPDFGGKIKNGGTSSLEAALLIRCTSTSSQQPSQPVVTMSSLPSNNETVGGNNTINGNGYPLSSSMNLFNQPSSSGARSGDEHRNGNETENENEDSRKGLSWMPQWLDDNKALKAEKKLRKANGTVNHRSVSQFFLSSSSPHLFVHLSYINFFVSS